MRKRGSLYLRSRMVLRGVQVADLAARWKRSSAYISDRLAERAAFNIQEVYDLIEWLDIPLEEIRDYFPPKNRKEWARQ